ncbi:hypothetical protein GCM10027280_11110 [Micromonospora polyrhachis]|uniref:Uncharacterized protein n=1 Tax=Micromonospora polyrhachis TaxID=1282883 RepID=A0A7W7SNK6_9ACTN|nr:hypothetical protein [Micromonospora polyrhachis]MBB4958033.1 hypothetical protein [Micromonospora polyrhachis]
MNQRYDAAGHPMTDAEAAAWDAEVAATAAAIRAEQEAAEDIRRMARQIRGYESGTPDHIAEIVKQIRGPL